MQEREGLRDDVYEAADFMVRQHLLRHPGTPAIEALDLLRGHVGDLRAFSRRVALEVAAPPSAPLPAPSTPAPVPAVPIAESVREDHLVCLEDGTRHVMMKRYLRRRFGLTPQAYRERWGLPGDYPMTAPGYSGSKSLAAKRMGLGSHPNKGRPRLVEQAA